MAINKTEQFTKHPYLYYHSTFISKQIHYTKGHSFRYYLFDVGHQISPNIYNQEHFPHIYIANLLKPIFSQIVS